MTILSGSDKQIAWATDIASQVLTQWNAIVVKIEDRAARAEAKGAESADGWRKSAEVARSIVNVAAQTEDAVIWIEHKSNPAMHLWSQGFVSAGDQMEVIGCDSISRMRHLFSRLKNGN